MGMDPHMTRSCSSVIFKESPVKNIQQTEESSTSTSFKTDTSFSDQISDEQA